MTLNVCNVYKHVGLLVLLLCVVVLQQEIVEENICQSIKYENPDIVPSVVKEINDLLTSDFLENDDWVIKKSSNLSTRPDFEDNFKDFDIKKGKELFVNFVKSYSFSVKGTTDIEFYVPSESSPFYFEHKINDAEVWTTFTLGIKDEMLCIYENYTKLIERITLIPTTLMIETPTEANFKIYEYEYKEAISVTKEQPYINKLKIPDSEEGYLIFSVSLCDSCILIARYNNKNCFMYSTNKNNNERWERYKMKVNPKIHNEVILSRLQRYPYNEGYWKLHLGLTSHSVNSATRAYTPLTKMIIIIILAIIIPGKNLPEEADSLL
ncbi:hypothetical protein Zmor_018560 [Zophobas morio]|uniref:Uncharacterized protein n=1 Tax=Zophobas morio TaxID=2755281 RepID=A0AA38ICM7_9CUCU|nr:hypothetical protein Zmor_018560 [Zophobas morio]